MGSDVQVQEVKNTVQENVNISETIKKLDNIRMFIYLFNEFGLPQVENEDKYIDYAVQHGSGLRVEDWYRTSLVGGTNLDYWGAIKQNCNDFGIDISNTNKYGFGWDFYTATRKFINSQSADTDKKSALKTWIDTLRDLDVIQARAELDKYLPEKQETKQESETNEAEKTEDITEKPVEITDKSVEKPENKTEKTVKTTLSAAEVLGNITGPQLIQKIQQTNKKPVETLFGVPLDEFKAEFGGRSYGLDYEGLLLTRIKYGIAYKDQTMFNTDCKIASFDEYQNGLVWVYDPDRQQYIQTEYYIAMANKLWHDNSLKSKKKSRQSIVNRVEQIGEIAGQFRLRAVERK